MGKLSLLEGAKRRGGLKLFLCFSNSLPKITAYIFTTLMELSFIMQFSNIRLSIHTAFSQVLSKSKLKCVFL